MLSHGNLVANLLQVNAWMKSGGLKEGAEVYITALPIYHIFALVANVLGSVSSGSQNILITNPRDMNGFVKELKKHKFTILSGVNTLFNGLLNHPEFKNCDFSKLRFGFGGGMRLKGPLWLEATAGVGGLRGLTITDGDVSGPSIDVSSSPFINLSLTFRPSFAD